jgi:hypothetical protein
MQAFAVVLALLAVAALGWALTMVARRVLRRLGVQVDEQGSARSAGAPGLPDERPSGDEDEPER